MTFTNTANITPPVRMEPMRLDRIRELPWPSPEGLSTYEYTKLLPKRRYWHEALGKLLYCPRTEMVVVIYQLYRGGGYAVVVVGNETYPVGGYNICVSEDEMETAIEVSLA